MLAIQFSKTELDPRIRDFVSSPSLERRGGHEDNRSASRGGVDLLPLPGFVKEFVEPKPFVLLDLWGPDFYLRSPSRVKRALPNRSRASVSLPSGGCFYSHSASCVKRETVPLVSGFLSTEGGCFYPSILLPSTPSSLPRNIRVPEGHPVLQGRCFYPSATGPSTAFRKRVAAFFRAFVGGARDLLPGPRPVKRPDAWRTGSTQPSQDRGSRLPRRSDSATAAAARSSRPASRARSCETMASS